MRPAMQIVVSGANARVKQLRAAIAGNARLSGGLLAVEGEHLLEEALRSQITPRTVFLAADRELPSRLDQLGVDIVRLHPALFAQVAGTRSPQGIAALVEPPQWRNDMIFGHPGQTAMILVLADLQDPGNVGTLLRSAEAFGATGVVLTPGTASPWSGKAMRASAGSVFRVPSVHVATAEKLRQALGPTRTLAAVGPSTATATRSRLVQDEDLAAPFAVLLGNEGTGLSAEWMNAANAFVTVPCSGPVESLNAAIAGAVLLYEAQQQRALHPRRSAPEPKERALP